MKMKDFLVATCEAWKKMTEILTFMRYPSADEVLGIKKILKKTFMDTVVFLILVATLLALSLVKGDHPHVGTSFMVFGSVYLGIFSYWFVGEFFWCKFVWNKRAKKTIEQPRA